jgi:hypothetical protein
MLVAVRVVIVFPLRVCAPFRTEPPCGGAAAQLNRTAPALQLRSVTPRNHGAVVGFESCKPEKLQASEIRRLGEIRIVLKLAYEPHIAAAAVALANLPCADPDCVGRNRYSLAGPKGA